jgi:Leucine-rich repeat (LRR) protein
MSKKILITAAALVLLGAGCSSSSYQTPPIEKPLNDTVAKNNDRNIEESIDISARGLTKVPIAIFDHIYAVSLNVSKNKLSGALPAEIRKMSKLRVLNMSNNKLTGIPAEVGQLSDLETLDVSNNQITGLPLEIGNLKKLKVLVLSGNKYSKIDLNKIKEENPNIQVVD